MSATRQIDHAALLRMVAEECAANERRTDLRPGEYAEVLVPVPVLRALLGAHERAAVSERREAGPLTPREAADTAERDLWALIEQAFTDGYNAGWSEQDGREEAPEEWIEDAFRRDPMYREKFREVIARVVPQGAPFSTALTDAPIIVYREDAGVFVAECRCDEETGEHVWFVLGGYEDITSDPPTHWQPLPSPPRVEQPRVVPQAGESGAEPQTELQRRARIHAALANEAVPKGGATEIPYRERVAALRDTGRAPLPEVADRATPAPADAALRERLLEPLLFRKSGKSVFYGGNVGQEKNEEMVLLPAEAFDRAVQERQEAAAALAGTRPARKPDAWLVEYRPGDKWFFGTVKSTEYHANVASRKLPGSIRVVPLYRATE